jgi:hypothetical protein
MWGDFVRQPALQQPGIGCFLRAVFCFAIDFDQAPLQRCDAGETGLAASAKGKKSSP